MRLWLLGLVLVLGLTACGGTGRRIASKTTDTQSNAFDADADKIAFLERYLLLASPIQAAEFHIVYHDNASGLIPGPSDWDMQAVMLVETADLARWVEGMQQVSAQNVDLTWANALIPQDQRWKITSQPAVYEKPGALVAIFEQEGIVFKRVWTT